MLVLDMESNRQRHPNVRLGEIGDLSAALSCGISGNMRNNMWAYDFNALQESEHNHISGFSEQISSEFTVSDPTRFFVDMQHNRENDNPNSMKLLSEDATTNAINLIKSKTSFETTAQIPRLKGPRSKRCRRTVFANPWNVNPCVDLYASVDKLGSATSRENFRNDAVSESIDRCNDEEAFRSSVNSVGRWLEDVGFGRYAGVFEMHEVDEEALPLLTFEDLKEMGVLAVGPRRKLYAAICELRDSRCGY